MDTFLVVFLNYFFQVGTVNQCVVLNLTEKRLELICKHHSAMQPVNPEGWFPTPRQWWTGHTHPAGAVGCGWSGVGRVARAGRGWSF